MPIYSAKEYDEKHGHKVERYPLPTDCATSNYPRLIHSEETWRLLQEIYYEVGYARKSYHHRVIARHEYVWYSGIDDRFLEVRDMGDGRGRGVYAIRYIREGTRLWYPNQEWVLNNAYFDSEEKMKNFLSRLPHDLQCDVTLWAYATQSFTKNQTTTVVDCNLDEASYFNHAERPELVNINALRSLATRDIEEGEELLMDYGSFIAIGADALPWWDKIRNTAWKAEEYKKIDSNSEETDGTSNANNSRSSSTATSQDAMLDGYVKYGAPKSMSSTTSGSAFADAHPMHGVKATNYDFFSSLAGLFLALVLTRSFAMKGLRRR